MSLYELAFNEFMYYKKYKQHDIRDCGAACLATVLSYYGIRLSLAVCREQTGTTLQGTNIYGIIKGAEINGLVGEAYNGNINDLIEGIETNEIHFPFIAHVITSEDVEHFVVVLSYKHNNIYIFDPAKGKYKLSISDFKKVWTGYIIVFEKSLDFKKNKQKELQIPKYIKILCNVKQKLIIAIVCSVLITIITLLGTLVYQQLIDKILLTDGNHTEEEYETEGNDDMVVGGNEDYFYSVQNIENVSDALDSARLLFATIIGAYLIQGLIQFLRGYTISKISRQIDSEIMKMYTSKLYDLKMEFFQVFRTGEILSRFTDIEQIRNFITYDVLVLFFDIITFVLGAIIMCIISVKLFLMSFVIMFLYLMVVLAYKSKIGKASNDLMAINGKLVSDYKENIEGMEITKLCNAQRDKSNKLYEEMDLYNNKLYDAQIIYTKQNVLTNCVSNIGIVMVLWMGAVLIINKQLTIGLLMTFSTLINYVISPIQEIVEMQPDMQKSFIALERLNDVLDSTKNEKDDNLKDNKIIEINKIDISHLSFGYGGDEKIVDNLSLTLHKGEKLALLGESGSGKSTLMKILLKIYKANNGKILFNEQEIDNISYSNIRSKVAYIPQETVLFSDSIRNNITMGNDDISEEKIVKVCEKCDIMDFINSTPFGLDTVIGENGRNLSGGQRQKFALARALVREPQVLILDEATSQIDERSEKNVLTSIFGDCDIKIYIIIAHKRSTIELCDKIAYMKNGHIVEYGTREDLRKMQKAYYDTD